MDHSFPSRDLTSNLIPGAHYDAERQGVRFTLFSANATHVTVCLYDSAGKTETGRLELQKIEDERGLWTGFAAGARPGDTYGYRVDGPFDPANGHRFNASKLLLDPYAVKTVGAIVHDQALFSYEWGTDPDKAENINRKDSAPYMPKAVITEMPPVDHRANRHPETPWARSFIYEAHVKGFSKRNPDVAEDKRGTMAGLADDASIAHLRKLGVTAVELMPVQMFGTPGPVLDRGLTNYWGYEPINYFAIHQPYLSGASETEFEDSVRKLHDAGIEVIMDVVYNHTLEGDERGPTLSFRGIDNASYYMLSANHETGNALDRSRYHNFSGCGNSLNANHPAVAEMIGRSMQHWIGKGVDGFRFDLGTIMLRNPQHGYAYDRNAPVARIIDSIAKGRDPFNGNRAVPGAPMLKLSAEPWDMGLGGYQLGNMPRGWREWNNSGKSLRKALLGGEGAGLLAARLSGSASEFNLDSKYPGRAFRNQFSHHTAARSNQSVIKLASHDGFRLMDSLEQTHRRNDANGENNRDGTQDDPCTDFAMLGGPEDEFVQTMRKRYYLDLAAMLFAASGTPMMTSGDEFGQRQQGNNNPYCQDNEISWLDWNQAKSPQGKELFEAICYLSHLRKGNSVVQRLQFPHGLNHGGVKDWTWINEHGEEKRWDTQGPVLGVLVDNASSRHKVQTSIPGITEKSRLLTVFNMAAGPQDFVLPRLPGADQWQRLFDTSRRDVLNGDRTATHAAGETIRLGVKSAVIFAQTPR